METQNTKIWVFNVNTQIWVFDVIKYLETNVTGKFDGNGASKRKTWKMNSYYKTYSNLNIAAVPLISIFQTVTPYII